MSPKEGVTNLSQKTTYLSLETEGLVFPLLSGPGMVTIVPRESRVLLRTPIPGVFAYRSIILAHPELAMTPRAPSCSPAQRAALPWQIELSATPASGNKDQATKCSKWGCEQRRPAEV